MGIHKGFHKKNPKWILKSISRFCFCGSFLFMLGACGEKERMIFTPSQAQASKMEHLQEKQTDPDVNAFDTDESHSEIYVHVCGAVVDPGLKKLPEGSRVWDALQLSGGFTQEADESAVNLAAFVEDGSKIYFPTREETERQKQEGAELLGINTADEKALMGLPGIGSAKAKAILKYRKEHGSFSKVEELLEVPGISDGILGQVRDMIYID